VSTEEVQHLRDLEAFGEELSRAGRGAGPELLWEAWEDWMWTGDPRRFIGDVWEAAEWPAQQLEYWQWDELWQAAGFTSSDGRDLPVKPLRVYRGSAYHGWSWTTSLEIARWFARRELLFSRHGAAVWTGVVRPERICALLDDRDEEEVVVRPDDVGSLRVLERI
jgi:hypothetical protein